MSLTERLTEELKSAMRAKDQVRLAAVRALRGEVIKLEKSGKGGEITDEDVTKIIKSQIKQRQDAITMFREGGREELAAKDEAEIEIFRTFLPAALSEEEICALVDQAIESEQAESVRDMGRVMNAVTGLIRESGKDADNRVVAGLVKARLS